jgi:hypothetical protein
LPEAVWFELRGQFLFVEHGVVAVLGFGWRDVADGLQQPALVEGIMLLTADANLARYPGPIQAI